ncbi:MAG: hypothetical protein N2255_08075 [Kiritimatiellae bacterium]|nr:hypothetical protein [Kiritimatiellia bacterium]
MVICIEAESAVQVTPPMEVVSATNVPMVNASEVSSGSYLEVAQGRGNPPKVTGEAVIRFEIKKAGQYELWCRVWWDDECGNSFTMVVDDGKPFVFGQDSTFKCWHWVRAPRLKQLYLEPGIHTLRVQNREDGVRLDQILFSSNQRYVPVGIEKPTGDQPNTGQGS